MAKSSLDSFNNGSKSNVSLSSNLVTSFSKSRNKLLSSTSSSTILSLLIKSAVDFALCEAL